MSDRGSISDGYHTFDELYEHRHMLFISLCNAFWKESWRSKLHEDGTMFDGGWFIAGFEVPNQGQITYHLPIRLWDLLDCREVERAPKWDGHTAQDVIERLRRWAEGE
jgi:hypothetical protein